MIRTILRTLVEYLDPPTESDPGSASTVCQACQGQGLVLATDPKDGMAVCFVCLGQGATS